MNIFNRMKNICEAAEVSPLSFNNENFMASIKPLLEEYSTLARKAQKTKVPKRQLEYLARALLCGQLVMYVSGDSFHLKQKVVSTKARTTGPRSSIETALLYKRDAVNALRYEDLDTFHMTMNIANCFLFNANLTLYGCEVFNKLYDEVCLDAINNGFNFKCPFKEEASKC